MSDENPLQSAAQKLVDALTFVGTGGNQFLLGWKGDDRPTVHLTNEEVHALGFERR
jgi:hypothetical protein